MFPKKIAHLSLCGSIALTLLMGASIASATVLTNPTITASADPYDGGYVASNVFDNGWAEFATSGNGAGTPLSTDVQDGTWIEFDFGSAVTMDHFVNVTRASNADVVGASRLIFSGDATFDGSDPTATFDPTGSNGQGTIFSFPAKTARYVRWEATTSTGSFQNLGSWQMHFMNTPAGQMMLPNPTVIAAATAYDGSHAAANAANGNAGSEGTGNEYASLNASTGTYVDFDFGSATAISGFDFFDRMAQADRASSFDLIFDDNSDFSSPIATRSYNPGTSSMTTSDTFAAITARYVRYDVTDTAPASNAGLREIVFYSPVPEPGSLTLLLMGSLASLGLRRKRKPR